MLNQSNASEQEAVVCIDSKYYIYKVNFKIDNAKFGTEVDPSLHTTEVYLSVHPNILVRGKICLYTVHLRK